MNPSPAFIPADLTHRDLLAAMLRDFYAEEHLELTAATFRALDEILVSPALGAACIIQDDVQSCVGYFVLTFTFSLERGGKTALLDELYIIPSARRKGFGKAALNFAIAEARRLHCKTVLLEVAHANPAAHALYTSLGFTTLPRHFLALSL